MQPRFPPEPLYGLGQRHSAELETHCCNYRVEPSLRPPESRPEEAPRPFFVNTSLQRSLPRGRRLPFNRSHERERTVGWLRQDNKTVTLPPARFKRSHLSPKLQTRTPMCARDDVVARNKHPPASALPNTNTFSGITIAFTSDDQRVDQSHRIDDMQIDLLKEADLARCNQVMVVGIGIQQCSCSRAAHHRVPPCRGGSRNTVTVPGLVILLRSVSWSVAAGSGRRR